MAKYLQKLIDKVLFHDLQRTDKDDNHATGKPRTNKDGKKPTAKRVVTKR